MKYKTGSSIVSIVVVFVGITLFSTFKFNAKPTDSQLENGKQGVGNPNNKSGSTVVSSTISSLSLPNTPKLKNNGSVNVELDDLLKETDKETDSEADSDNKESNEVANGIVLNKENVPKPEFFHKMNVHLDINDYKAILEQFDQSGAPFKYTRSRSDKLFFGRWWIEHVGYDDSGLPLFEITNLLGFSKKYYELTNEFYDTRYQELAVNSALGEYNHSVENFARDGVINTGSYLESLMCRTSICLLKIRHTEQTEFDVMVFTKSLKAQLQKQNPNKVCQVERYPIKPHGNVIYVECT